MSCVFLLLFHLGGGRIICYYMASYSSIGYLIGELFHVPFFLFLAFTTLANREREEGSNYIARDSTKS